MTIADKIREVYAISHRKRLATLESIKAPEVVLQAQIKLMQACIDGTFKLPGEIRGFFAPYLAQPFKTGYTIMVGNYLEMYFEIEGDKVAKYLHVYRNRWKSIEISRKPTLPVKVKPIQ